MTSNKLLKNILHMAEEENEDVKQAEREDLKLVELFQQLIEIAALLKEGIEASIQKEQVAKSKRADQDDTSEEEEEEDEEEEVEEEDDDEEDGDDEDYDGDAKTEVNNSCHFLTL